MIENLVHRNTFRKHYQKRILPSAKLDRQYRARIAIFINNPSHPILRDHSLTGIKEGLRAFSITGDIRVIYRFLDEHTIELLDIGTHNQVYK